MKTKLVRPLLLHSDEAVKIGSIMQYVKLSPIHGPLGSLVLNVNPYIVKSNVWWQLNHLYLLSLDSDERIEIGDMYYESKFLDKSPLQKCSKDFEAKKATECKFTFKIIATQEQLSTELIQKLIDEYNTDGMKDFEIEMEPIGAYSNPKYLSDYKIKLTNSFITPVLKGDKVVKENLYTKDDLKKAFMGGNCWIFGVKERRFKEWFNEFERDKKK